MSCMKQFIGTLIVLIPGSVQDSHFLILLRCKSENSFKCIILIWDFKTSEASNVMTVYSIRHSGIFFLPLSILSIKIYDS